MKSEANHAPQSVQALPTETYFALVREMLAQDGQAYLLRRIYMDIKVPQTKADMEELRKSLVQELLDDDLDTVAGGNDDLKDKIDMDWTCPFCGTVVKCKLVQDAAKHMVKCPGNPYK